MKQKNDTQLFSVSDKTVCIVGCGALGTNAAVHLAGAGVKKVYLCDFDTVNLSNLNRQFLFRESDVGSFKCELLKKRLTEYSSDTDFVSVNLCVNSEDDLIFAKDSDIILCCVDNVAAREIIAEFSCAEGIPSAYGCIDGFYGNAYLYIPGKTPCPYCAGAISDKSVESSVSSSAGIIGSMQANLALRYLLDDFDPAGKIFLFDGDLWDTLSIKKSNLCKNCNKPEVKI